MRFFSDWIGMKSNCKIVFLKKKHIYFSWPICQGIFSAITFLLGLESEAIGKFFQAVVPWD